MNRSTTGFGVPAVGKRLGVERGLGLRLVERHVVVAHLALVEAVVRELAAVGRPPHRRALAQLFAVHPAGGAVFDAACGAAVGRDRARVAAVGGAQPDVAIVVEGLQRAVRRSRRLELPPAIRRSPRPTCLARPPGPAAAANLRRLQRRDVVAIALAVPVVLERLAPFRPRRQEGAPAIAVGASRATRCASSYPGIVFRRSCAAARVSGSSKSTQRIFLIAITI